MNRSWTFGRKLGLGFGLMVVLIVLVGVMSISVLRDVSREKDQVVATNARLLIDAQKMLVAIQMRIANARGYIISKDGNFMEGREDARQEFAQALTEIESLTQDVKRKEDITRIKQASLAMANAHDRVVGLVKSNTSRETINQIFESEAIPRARDLEKLILAFVDKEENFMEAAKKRADDAVSMSIWMVNGIVAAGIFVAALLAFFLTRLLSRQIGSAIQHIQSSSSELQAAANQQTTGTREQVTSMNEINVTIKELLSTARQISESSQRVAHIAGETASAARSGDMTVQKAQEAIGSIKRQVDMIVAHMLDLGKKSQQIGGILEIINELAEQTNILSINATIEAAGAGEMGKRFVVVADEIRKLADRVSGSTKDIRSLIEEIRSAVNTTVMATESGSKAVDAGTKQFGDVTVAFKQIATLVGTTTEAAREIELSTKQQTTSVEQVSGAITNIAQTAKESEASSTQTLQTVSELASLSRSLTKLIQSPAQA